LSIFAFPEGNPRSEGDSQARWPGAGSTFLANGYRNVENAGLLLAAFGGHCTVAARVN
jgi:hypothetical protein